MLQSTRSRSTIPCIGDWPSAEIPMEQASEVASAIRFAFARKTCTTNVDGLAALKTGDKGEARVHDHILFGNYSTPYKSVI